MSRSAVNRLKKDAKLIRSVKLSENGKTADARWLYENRIRILRFAERALCGIKSLVGSVGEKKAQKLYRVSSDILEEAAYSLSEEELIKALLARQSQEAYFSLPELWALEDVLTAVLIERIALSAKKGLDDGFAGAAVSMLYELGSIDFENVLSAVSLSEAVLRDDPSGVYALCDGETKRMYRRKLTEVARRETCDEYKMALLYKRTAETLAGKERHIGYLLMKDSLLPFGKVYFLLLYTVPLVISILLTVLAYRAESTALMLAAAGAYFPIRLLTKKVVDDVLMKRERADIVPRLALNGIPDECRTVITFTTVLSNAEKDKRLFDKIEKYARAYKDKNLFFAVLADLPDSETETSPGDEELLRFAKGETERINSGLESRRVCFLARRRSFSVSEGKYMGKERKRGAQEAFFSLLSGEACQFSTVSGAVPENVSYVLALDTDSEIMLSDLNKLIASAAHPSNLPEYTVVNGRTVVSNGYGIIAPRAEISLKKADSFNRYTLLSNAYGGRSLYESAAFNVYAKLFGTGLFCGKGLINADAYCRVLKGAFPRECILSHDIAEGQYLRCAFAADVCIYDSPPFDYLSEIKRAHRWIRGDVQSLALACKYIKDEKGTVSKSPLSLKSKLMLTEPLADIFADIFRVLSVIISLLSGKIGFLVFLFSVSDHLYSILKMIVSAAKIPKRRYLSGFPDYYKVLLYSAFMPLLGAAMRCFYTADAFIRAVWRMKLSKCRLLEWSVFDPSGNSGKSFGECLRKTKASVFIGALSIMLSLFSKGAGAVILCLSGLCWCAFPYVIYVLSGAQPKPAKKTDYRKEFCEDARLMWRFFETYVTEEYCYLPPDNVTFLPEYKIAERTSPTNIGLYLLSLLNAFDFGFIDGDELYRRLDGTLTTVSRLEKKWGHLYNWYDIKTCRVLYPAYVSTVDSGNLVASLIAVKNGISHMGALFAPIVSGIESIVDGADFKKLYSQKRDLFHIGYNGALDAHDKNVYDLYSSEMLITSYYAAAKGDVPSSHMAALGRIWLDNGGLSHMLSWSGGAFEYFMPSIFLPTVNKTERGEAMLSAYREQRKKEAVFEERGIYGVSESSFYDFDDSMNYRYKAHGAASLALSRHVERENVYSPYSMYLMASYDENICENLRGLRDTDLYGRYGFFDAIDLTRSRVGSGYGITRLYMAHHVGMSIASLANLCFDNVNVKRFMSEPAMGAAEHLLYGKIEICRPRSGFDAIMTGKDVPAFATHEGTVTEKGAAVVSNGRERIVADENGVVVFYSGGKLISQPCGGNINGFHALLLVDGIIYDCLCGRSAGKGVRGSFYSDGASAVYKNDIVHGDKLITTELTLTVSPDEPRIAVRLCLSGDAVSATAMFFMLPVINRRDDYCSSPSYSDLFVTVNSGNNNETVYKRKTGDGEYYLKVFTVPEAPSAVFTRADDVLAFPADVRMLNASFYKNGEDVSGPAVHPCFLATLPLVPMENKEVLGAELHLLVNGEGEDNSFDSALRKAKRHFDLTTSLAGADASALKTAFQLLTAINEEGTVTKINGCDSVAFRRDIFWRHGISGDLPIAAVFVPDDIGASLEFMLCDILRAKRFLFISGVRFDLVFIVETGGYFRKGEERVLRLTEECGCRLLMGKNNGIFLVDRGAMTENDEAVFIAFASAVIKCGDVKTVPFEKPCGSRERYDVLKEECSLQKAVIGSGHIAVGNGRCASPYSFIYANTAFGTLLTNRTAGFTWRGNSSLFSVSRRHRDPIAGEGGEALTLKIGDASYDLLRHAKKTVYGDGNAEYSGKIGDSEYRVKIGVDARYPVKLFAVTLDRGLEDGVLTLTHYLPCHAVYNGERLIYLREDSLSATVFSVPHCHSFETEADARSVSYSRAAISGTQGFVLAAYPSSAHERLLPHLKSIFSTADSITAAFMRYSEWRKKLIPSLIYGGKRENEADMMNLAAHQAVYFRMLARCGYSQPGGAYGFRDQLQDALSSLYYKPELLKYQILRSCYNQYTDGRVAHWWHPGVGGLKSRCSDDYMWLPYAVAEYVLATGDLKTLSLKVRCLISPPLGDGEEDRYEKPPHTEEKYSVLEHCLMAIDESMERGVHGLPPMLSGDWNDGMNGVGAKGKGESVWLAFFFALTYKRFAEVMYALSDETEAERLKKAALELINAAERAWEDDRYLRAYDDDGVPLGSEISEECKIDVLPQAFSVFAEADRERSVIAMETAYNKLFDSSRGILRLFAPSFDKTDKYGYICRYPAGIRENGGQYTHAALWAAMAFFELGAYKRGLEILSALTPLNIHENGAMNGKYTSEPYLMCADVYYGENITGKSGWSGYTGSAAWYYRAVMEHVIGVRLASGSIRLAPPPEFVNGDYSFTFRYKESCVSVVVQYGEGKAEATEAYDKTVIMSEGESVLLPPNIEFAKILIKVIK